MDIDIGVRVITRDEYYWKGKGVPVFPRGVFHGNGKRVRVHARIIQSKYNKPILDLNVVKLQGDYTDYVLVRDELNRTVQSVKTMYTNRFPY